MGRATARKQVPAPAKRRWSIPWRAIPWRAIRAVGLFAAFAGVWFWGLGNAWLREHLWYPYTDFVPIVSGWIFRLFGAEVVSAGPSMSVNGTSLTMEFGCNGLEAVGLYIAAILASAMSWKRKLQGLGVGFIAISIINQIRVCGLYLAAMAGPSYFDFAHIIVGQTFVIVLTMGVFLWWDSRDDRDRQVDTPPILA